MVMREWSFEKISRKQPLVFSLKKGSHEGWGCANKKTNIEGSSSSLRVGEFLAVI